MKFFFCYNKISFLIAKDYRKIYKYSFIILFKSRVKKESKTNLSQIYYNKFNALIIFFLSLISKKIEIIIPHTNGGKIIKLMSIYSKNLSFIDDGMDTFRDKPKNINLKGIKKNTKYYSFNYKIPVANWLQNFLIIKVSDILNLDRAKENIVDLKSYNFLIIESNGINFSTLTELDDSTLVIKHPSKIKNNNLVESKYNSIYCSNLESSISNYNGKIIIGETMVLIYLLHSKFQLQKILLQLKKADYNNLTCLHSIFNKTGKLILV